MAKKTYADRLGQYLSMLQGNDVEENFSSERTAKAEYNKMIEVIEYWRNPYFYYVTRDKDEHTPEDLDWAWRWIENNTGARREELEPLYEELLNIKENGKLRTDCCSVKDGKIYHETPPITVFTEGHSMSTKDITPHLENILHTANKGQTRQNREQLTIITKE